MADEEDVALSAFHSLCQGAARGRFPDLQDRNNLWKLLLTITAQKALDHRRREGRLKRGGGQTRVATGSSPLADTEDALAQVAGREPTPEFAAQMAEQYQPTARPAGGRDAPAGGLARRWRAIPTRRSPRGWVAVCGRWSGSSASSGRRGSTTCRRRRGRPPWISVPCRCRSSGSWTRRATASRPSGGRAAGRRSRDSWTSPPGLSGRHCCGPSSRWNSRSAVARGESPTQEEYAVRFPGWADVVCAAFEDQGGARATPR